MLSVSNAQWLVQYFPVQELLDEKQVQFDWNFVTKNHVHYCLGIIFVFLPDNLTT